MTEQQAGHVPGYTGHVVGQRDSFGSTFGHRTAEAREGDPVYRDLRTATAMAAGTGGMASEDVEVDMESTAAGRATAGYTGHLPFRRETIGKTFGGTKEACLRAQASNAAGAEEGLSTRLQTLLRSHQEEEEDAAAATERPEPECAQEEEEEDEQPAVPKSVPGYTGHRPFYHEQCLGKSYTAASLDAQDKFDLPPEERLAREKTERLSKRAAQSRGPVAAGATVHMPGSRDMIGVPFARANQQSQNSVQEWRAQS